MSETVAFPDIRCRLRDLNTKAYYLLVALSFIYYHGKESGSPAPKSLKWALTLTSVVAVLPVQDYLKSKRVLEGIRFAKVVLMWAAFVCTIVWIWNFS